MNQQPNLTTAPLMFPHSLTNGQIFLLLVLLVISITVTSLVGQWLWNNLLVKYLTVVKPIEKWYEFLGLQILMLMLFKSK